MDVYLESALEPEHVHEFGAPRVVLATGAHWRGDGVGRVHNDPIPGIDGIAVSTPDDVMEGALPAGPVLVYDDDHYYMASLVAEVLARAGRETLVVTPASDIAEFTRFTLEHERIARRLHERRGGNDHPPSRSNALDNGDEATLRHVLTGPGASRIEVGTLVPVTAQGCPWTRSTTASWSTRPGSKRAASGR